MHEIAHALRSMRDIRLPTLGHQLSWGLISLLVLFIAFDWYLESDNLAMDSRNRELQLLSCDLILEGFLIRSESEWGQFGSESVMHHWVELDCGVHLRECSRLERLYTKHSRAHMSSSFLEL